MLVVFLGDLRTSARAIRRCPPLWQTALLLGFFLELPVGLWYWLGSEGWIVLVLPVMFFQAGLAGAQRRAFRRLFSGEDVELAGLRVGIREQMGRFVRLGALSAVIYLPVSFVLDQGVGRRASAVASSVLIDVLFTFVSPALAFTSSRARTAFALGVRMLRAEWPRCMLHAVTPPLALTVLFNVLLSQLFSFEVLLALAVASFVPALLLKGAQAAYYLRVAPPEPPAVF